MLTISLQEKFYSINQLSELLQVSGSTIRNLISNKELSYIKIGNSIKITESEVIKYLNNNAVISIKTPNKDLNKNELKNVIKQLGNLQKSNIYIEHHQIPHNYNPEAKCYLWKKCLEDWFPYTSTRCDSEKLALQEFFGYILAPHNEFGKGLILNGGIGKATIEKIASYMVGEKLTSFVNIGEMENSKKLLFLKGRKLNLANHNNEKITNLETITKLIKNEKFEIVKKYQPAEKSQSIAKHIISMNFVDYLPNENFLFLNLTRKNINGLDSLLLEKLQTEINGIINWSLDGLKRITANNGKFSI